MITHKKLSNGFLYIEIKNSSAKAKIALQGAHIFEYVREDEDGILWLSEISDFEQGKAIRGGVPICWPWFGFNEDKNLPQHGFARIYMWEFIGSDEVSKDKTTLIFRLTNNEQTLKIWDYKFELELKITISKELKMELKTTNMSESPFKISQALHTYFNVSHISEVIIKGLDKKPYLDALSWQKEIQNGDIYFEKEVDRVYQEVDTNLVLVDKNREIKIKNTNSTSAVIWNPWIEKTSKMSAMKENAYEHFVCIESANTFDDTRVIEPKKSHTLIAQIF